MSASREGSSIDGVVVVVPERHVDHRGAFAETYRRSWFPGAREMVQGNRADRSVGSLVGLHYHLRQADYWSVVAGTARIVLHDLRIGSPTDGVTWTTDLDGGEPRGVYIPPGVAHGFCALTDVTLTYLVDGYYDPSDELGVAWDDPHVGADWGLTAPTLSARDLANPRRSELSEDRRPRAGT